MDVREKLVELLTDNLPRCGNLPSWDNPLQLSCDEQVQRIADHLIMNGVTVQTNADRIRAMSDESVAAVLKTLCTAIIDCMGCPLYRFGCPGNNDLNDWIKWIQQPAEENKNGV